MQEYRPETTSSNIIPNPPFNFSALFAGYGFIISNTLQIINVTIMKSGIFGVNKRAIHVPTNSSSVNWDGSSPYVSSKNLPILTPITKKIRIVGIIIRTDSNPGIKKIPTATILAKVPGA